MTGRKVVFVLGMGRSGTSAIARVLSLCGGSLPERLLGPNQGNLRGHWEPLDALELNESFLADFGSSWYDPSLGLQARLAPDDPACVLLARRIGALFASWPDGDFLVVKEPRITALAGIWLDAARRAGFAVTVLIPVRDPVEAAASLAARDGLGAELSLALWLKYNLVAERASRSLPRVFVSYPALLEDWRGQIGRIGAALSLDLAAQANGAEIEAFLSAALHRQRGGAETAGGDAGRLYRMLLEAAQSAAGPVVPDPAELDAMFTRFGR